MRIDLKTERRDLYQPSARSFVDVEVPPMRYLAADGHGDPNISADYAHAVESLYTTAYAMRAALKERMGNDFVVGPLERLWSSADPSTFVARRKDDWDWTMLTPLPDLVDAEDLEAGPAAAAARKPELPIGSVRILALDEGRCLQIMHLGPYDDEGPTLALLHDEVMPGRGLTWNGPHHEISLGDPRRSAPERLRTVQRQPVRPIG